MYSIIYYALWGLGIPLFSRTFAWSLPILILLSVFETDDDDPSSIMITGSYILSVAVLDQQNHVKARLAQ
jgi:hypothetical protein